MVKIIDTEGVSLDTKDCRLILALYEDGRAGTTELGRKTGMSQERTTYRLKRLQERSIVQRIVPILDYSALGYTTYRLQLKLMPGHKEQKADFREYAHALPQISWYVRLSGDWDVALLLNIQTNEEFTNLYDELMTRYGGIIDDKLFTIVTAIHHYPPSYLLQQERHPIVQTLHHRAESIDETDKNILTHLFTDGRTPVLRIARQLGLSATAVTYRLDQLRRKGVLLGFRPVINLKALGYEHYKVVMELQNPGEKKLVKARLAEEPHVVYITESLGRYDIEFECECTTVDDVLRIITSITDDIHVRKYDIIFTNEEQLINEVPK